MVPRRGTIPRRSGPKQAPNPPARHGPPAVRGGGARGAPAPPAAGAGSSAHARLHEILREYAWREGPRCEDSLTLSLWGKHILQNVFGAHILQHKCRDHLACKRTHSVKGADLGRAVLRFLPRC